MSDSIISRKFFLRGSAATLATSCTSGLLARQSAAAQPAGQTAPSAEDFGRLPAISSVTISPDGRHIAAITSQDGKTAAITVWDTQDFSKPVGIGSDPRVSFMSVAFVKDNRLLVRTRQLLDYGNYRGFLFKNVFTDLTGSKWFSGAPDERSHAQDSDVARMMQSAEIVSLLSTDAENILAMGDGGAIYKANLVTGKFALQERVGDQDGDLIYDNSGQLRAKSRINFTDGNLYISQMLRHPDTGEFNEHFRAYAKDRELPKIASLTKDPNIVLIAARRGKDHTGLYNYDIRAKAFKDAAFEHPLFDVSSNVLKGSEVGEIVAFTYMADRPIQYYLDDKLDAAMQAIGKALGVKSRDMTWTDLATGKPVKFSLPDGANLSLIDFSKDYSSLVVNLSGPAQPDTYFLYRAGKGLQPLGQSRPWLKTALFAAGELQQFKARDGRPIPAFVYKPNAQVFGPGPYPTLIIPHGGPWSRDYLEWDVITPWAQYFVARGYAVAMPQYRGSEGWGMAQWTAGDSKWGEAMSDDMDDVALGMVAQGVADRKRLCMHGYSFGGYSAMAAIVRPNPIYQCAISGAGPYSPRSMQNETGDSRFGREFQRPFVGGLDAKANVDKASIPILIYHGDRDTNVKPEESKAFYDALIGAHKTARRVVFKDMGHEADKWSPEHVVQLLNMIDNYLSSECKPGGL